jgi:hypothetical protein
MGELFLRYALGVAQAVLIEDYPISSEINLQFYRGFPQSSCNRRQT